jgi:hypothetical protein
MLHFQFLLKVVDGESFPLTLSEMDELEKKMRATPGLLPPFHGSGKIVDHGERINLPYRFPLLQESK